MALIALRWPPVLYALVILVPLFLLGLRDSLQRKRALLRNYPIIGRGRYLLEEFRPEIQQYFVETNIEGKPFSREFRSVVYQRAKGALQTHPFGTQREVYNEGYEWMNHSLAPKHAPDKEPRVEIGAGRCKQPYMASHLNISAMSYGSLSKNAILALNKGAKAGGFCHNTGEGGVSPHHLSPGGDLTWQIGTGYFGCRTEAGAFSPERFKDRSQLPSVKMIEIKLSQGAKPAHGGILPAAKVTKEVAEIRGVPLGEDVLSPPGHSTFHSPKSLLEFIAQLRELSGGKPVGFKLCVGRRAEFLSICKAMLESDIRPDFITVDGAEGGTGAAPLEFANSVGTPLREGLLFVHNALVGCGLRKDIRVIASGKIVTGFHMIRAMALGADLCNSARAMMFAIGCIQARRCNQNDCPVGVATGNPALGAALDVDDKAERVARYHSETIFAFLELIGAAGLDSPDQIAPEHVYRRVAHNKIQNYPTLFNYLKPGELLGAVPVSWRQDWQLASAEHF